MQQPPPNQPQGEATFSSLSTIQRQLERLDERTRDLATRQDLEALRKEVVARDLLEPQLVLLRTQIARLETDRVNDRKELEKRIEDIEKEQASRSERLWMKLSPAIAALAFIISLIEFLSHLKFTP